MTKITFGNNTFIEIKVAMVIDEYAIDMLPGNFMDTSHKDFDWDELKRGSIIDISHMLRDYNPNHNYRYYKPDMSVTEHRKGLVEIGYSKGTAEELARQYCMADAKRITSLHNNEWFCLYYTTNINLYINGRLNSLNVTAYSISVESDHPEGKIDALTEVWYDMIDDINSFGLSGFSDTARLNLLQGYLAEIAALDDINAIEMSQSIAEDICSES